MKKMLLIGLALLSTTAWAEYGRYGNVTLQGLSRNAWEYRDLGLQYTMVCNVNGRDGFLSVRSGPGTQYGIRRQLNRLAILTVDTRYRHGNWIYVRTAIRAHDPWGYRLDFTQNLHVEGWAHTGYMCEFLSE